eukprot:TRINITY_DN28705_c2_g1_i1.p1 TRINITY_DN28705_c2_g1~~TRINITY_DN28705_c2_g1_i1.p1  ORF type:complete len:595 (+),score=139.63 TRINITY_DN28705_c2_g1_i1:85-1785(+)
MAPLRHPESPLESATSDAADSESGTDVEGEADAATGWQDRGPAPAKVPRKAPALPGLRLPAISEATPTPASTPASAPAAAASTSSTAPAPAAGAAASLAMPSLSLSLPRPPAATPRAGPLTTPRGARAMSEALPPQPLQPVEVLATARDCAPMETPRRRSGPSRESPGRAELLRMYSGKASEVIPGRLYVGDLRAAGNRDMLLRLGVAHVLDFCGLGDERAWPPGRFSAFPLKDSPHEDLGACIYDVLDIVASCLHSGGAAFLHCEKGASRSCAFAVACLMHVRNVTYAAAMADVTTARPICDPNIGFQCQLLEWQKRRNGWECQGDQESGLSALWRVVASEPDLKARRRLVARLCISAGSIRTVRRPCRELLDSRSAFVLVPDLKRLPLVLWIGLSASNGAIELARRLVPQLRRYEGLGLKRASEVVYETQEPTWLLEAFERWRQADLADTNPPAPAATCDFESVAAVAAAEEEAKARALRGDAFGGSTSGAFAREDVPFEVTEVETFSLLATCCGMGQLQPTKQQQQQQQQQQRQQLRGSAPENVAQVPSPRRATCKENEYLSI